MSKSTDLSTLGDRLKAYESTYESTLPEGHYLVIRLDGHGFSKYTRGLAKPFDDAFSLAMITTSEVLLTEFQAVCTYTQSDEITIVLPPRAPTRGVTNQIYASRIQKITSLTAGFCSAYFNSVFTHPFSQRIPYFDARVYAVPSIEEAYNSIMWRCRDAEKNSKNVFAQTYCKHRNLLNLTSQQQIEFCLATTNMDWTSVDPKYKYGITTYKQRVWVDADPTNPRALPAYRNIVISEGIDLTSFDEDLMYKLLTKDNS